ncbi:hypothetical protein AV530_018414 [Patagioenas fasciata monilis]|uniref:Uncharacterized protein n=1 Tax=Patagioenas fasciata monilis TaxID=372326 RepID=A0A1V4JRX3_PATFA|nr:hypothetical protein AV530_018414 [Patagioenas fasciata monilis]
MWGSCLLRACGARVGRGSRPRVRVTSPRLAPLRAGGGGGPGIFAATCIPAWCWASGSMSVLREDACGAERSVAGR